MTHLKIEQNNGIIEEVSSAVIDKLYDIVHSGTLDNTSNLIGRLHTSATYQDYIDYLEDTFKVDGVKLLIIDATKKYMSFADPEVASYWANSSYGDGTGIDSTAANSVLSIPNSAFKNNTNILTFDELNKFVNCTIVGSEAFRGCTNLTSINLSNITTLSDTYAFHGCTSLSTISLPKLTNLGSYNNFSSTGLTLINLGADVSDANKITTIPKNTFNTSSSLTKVTGLNKVVVIEENAFYRCYALLEVDLSSELTTLKADVFASCSNLLCVDITNVTSITGSELFMYDSKLVDLATSDPTQINTGVATYTFSWSTISDRMFAGCLLTNKSFVLPNVTSIGASAFSATLIVSIDAPSATSISNAAFDSAKLLATINFPNILTIGQGSFYKCYALTSVSLPSCTSIGNQCFRECMALTTVSIPNCTTINSLAFMSCTALQTITMPSTITSIGSHVFYDCISLASITLPSNLTLLPENLLRNCTSLTSVTIPSGVTDIGAECFRHSGLVSISIPDAVMTIGNYCFKECYNLASVTFEPTSTLTTLGNRCFGNTSLTSIDIPDSCTTIGDSCFEGISTLTRIVIGTGIQSIVDAFKMNNNNPAYTLTVKATTPPTITNTNSKKPSAIYVPSASVSDYLTAAGWSNWADVILAIPT